MAGSLFRDEEIRDIAGLKKGEDFVEVTCGCTSKKFGDSIGRLKVFGSGDLEVRCDCFYGCQEEILTPSEFEKHAKEEDAQKRWKLNIWVIVRGKKVPLLRTSLLKYYEKAESSSGSYKGRPPARPFHRDEFIRCIKCDKERRFRLQTKEECRNYHDAMLNANWKCSDFPLGKTKCDDKEERTCQRVLKGCPHDSHCEGCTECVCFGCKMCRFSDCNCRTCVDFTRNADII